MNVFLSIFSIFHFLFRKDCAFFLFSFALNFVEHTNSHNSSIFLCVCFFLSTSVWEARAICRGAKSRVARGFPFARCVFFVGVCVARRRMRFGRITRQNWCKLTRISQTTSLSLSLSFSLYVSLSRIFEREFWRIFKEGGGGKEEATPGTHTQPAESGRLILARTGACGATDPTGHRRRYAPDREVSPGAVRPARVGEPPPGVITDRFGPGPPYWPYTH